jgi:Ca-activated chloride channel family protein
MSQRRRSSRLLVILLLAAACSVATHLAAAPPAGAPARPAGAALEIVSPRGGTPAFGEVDLQVRSRAKTPVAYVDFYVDGQKAGRVNAAPWKLHFDVGQSNLPHQFKAVATDVLGATTEAVLRTPSIPADMSFDVRLQQLFVSVTANGSPVHGLKQGDFEIVDERGNREPITTFNGGELPLSAVLLLDSSESMKGEPLQAALAGVRSFVARTRPDDETMVAFFSDRLLAATTFTKDDAALQRALGDVQAVGGTAVNDHLYYALNRLQPRLGRRVIVLLSDGLDVSSQLDMEQVLWRARRSQAMVYWLRLESEANKSGAPMYISSWRGAADNQRQFQLLEQVVKESGGRIVGIHQLSEIDDAFRVVIDELREQYVLGFQPSNMKSDGKWHGLDVKVRGDYAVRSRTGFID